MLRKILSYHPASQRSTRENVGWALHNIVGHPLSELAFWLGSERLSNQIHDWTLPKHDHGTGRG